MRAPCCARGLLGALAIGTGLVVAAPLPSGRLLYTKLTNGTWQIWLREFPAGSDQQVTFTAGDKRYPVWRTSQDVAYCTMHQSCFTQRLGDQRAEPVLRVLWPIRGVAWSPDGQQMVFSRFRADLIDSANLWIAQADGSQARMLTHEPGIQQHAAWSPDGQWVAYSAGQGPQSYEIYVTAAAGGTPRQLTSGQQEALLPAWSPDGRWMAFSSSTGGDFDIWIIGADGTGLKALTRAPGLDTAPAWMPDGSRLMFASHRRGQLELWTMGPDGSDQQPLQERAAPAGDPAWYPEQR